MRKFTLLLALLLLLSGCAKAPEAPVPPAGQAKLPEQAQIGTILSISPSYDTKYFAHGMPLIQDEQGIATFRAAYEQVLPALTETNETIPEGDQYFFDVYHKKGDEKTKLYLRLVDDGKGCWLEMKPKNRNPEWVLTYALTRDAAQPLLDFFADEPTGKPHIKGYPDGRVVSILERIEKGWPIFEGRVISVSDKVKEFSLHEELRYGWLYREFTVEVAKCYNGDLKEGDKLTYRVFGGETEDYSFSVENAPQAAVGDYVVIAAPEHSFATAYNVFPATQRMQSGYPYYTYMPPAGFLPDGLGLTPRTYATYHLSQQISSWRYQLSEPAEALKTTPERVPERQLEELRLRYSYFADYFPMASMIGITSWDHARAFAEHDGLVILDFIGEYRLQSGKVTPRYFEGPELDYLASASGENILFARVEEVLLGGEGLKVGDLIPVYAGGSTLSPLQTVMAVLPGQHFVCTVRTLGKDDPAHLSGAVSVNLSFIYRLTPEGVVLYSGGSGNTVLDECSGMYLPAFTELIHEKLFSK